jgi:mitochondrial intermediate peptidase
MKYHSQTGPVDSTYIAHEVYRDYAPLPTISPYSRITPQANFTHLFSYGASYYSYLFDRAIASKIWKEVFEMDPLSREAGEKYIQEVLKWGGGRDGWECVAGILGRDDLRGGGDEAMEHVGEWGIERQVGGLN